MNMFWEGFRCLDLLVVNGGKISWNLVDLSLSHKVELQTSPANGWWTDAKILIWKRRENRKPVLYQVSHLNCSNIEDKKDSISSVMPSKYLALELLVYFSHFFSTNFTFCCQKICFKPLPVPSQNVDQTFFLTSESWWRSLEDLVTKTNPGFKFWMQTTKFGLIVSLVKEILNF